MALVPVTISDGQVSGVDSLSSAASSVVNFDIDEAGISRPRPPLVADAITGMSTLPVSGLAKFKQFTIVTVSDGEEYSATTAGALDGRKVYAINDASPTTAVELTGTYVGAPFATALGSSRPRFVVGQDHIYIVSGRAGYTVSSTNLSQAGTILRWDGVTASLSCAADVEATHICSLGQRLIANDTTDPQVFRWSAIGDGNWTSWPAGNVSEADARPDPVVAVDASTNELFVWGTQTLQVYAVGSDPTFPFEPVVAMNIGISAPYSMIRLDEAFAFIDDKKRIVISDGRTVQPIGDAILRDIRGMSDISDAHGWRFEYGQQSYLVWRFPTAGRTFVYCLKTQKWQEWKRYLAPFQRDFPGGAYLYRETDEMHVVGLDTSTGGLAHFTDWPAQELGGPLVAERTTGWTDHGTENRKRSTRVRVTMRRGTAAEGSTPGALEVRVQDDDGPWSPWEQVSVGGPDDYAQTVDLYMGGIFRRRRYGLRYSSSDDTAITRLSDDVTDLGEG